MSASTDPADNAFGWGEAAASPADDGLSLEQLNQAFAQMLGTGDDPYQAAPPLEPPAVEAELVAVEPVDMTNDDEHCQIQPRSILEAMLFVGKSDNQPLAASEIAKWMRGVRPAEIDDLVKELNAQYAFEQRPYEIVSVEAGYRLVLCDAFSAVRQSVYGKSRQHRLSPQAIETLAIVAYHGPIAGDAVSKLRGSPSNSILAQLVRRQLLAVDKSDTQPRQIIYRTTHRFLELFGLDSLDDLPRSQDIDRQ